MSLRLDWIGGGSAVVLSTDGNRVTLRSTRSAPPGSPLAASFENFALTNVRVKVHGCHKNEDGSFVIEARFLDLTKDSKAQIVQASEPSRDDSSS